ncbi:MAG: hypothetical protein IPF92_03960 [Myxococcales bacterium]|nr:hypothetical protein [Myxococcales bacterium]MBL0196583.1 hypothetical protein [Myxococcales bacterium]
MNRSLSRPCASWPASPGSFVLVVVAALAGCGGEAPAPTTPVATTPTTAAATAAPAPAPSPRAAPSASTVAPPAPPVAAPSAAAACTAGAVRCEGIYVGKVKPSNNKPAGARVTECRAGAWVPIEACDASKNMGCYVLDDPALGHDVARCLSTFSRGE